MLMDTVKKKLGYMVRSEKKGVVCHNQDLQNKPVCPPGPFLILKPVMAIRNLQL